MYRLECILYIVHTLNNKTISRMSLRIEHTNSLYILYYNNSVHCMRNNPDNCWVFNQFVECCDWSQTN